MLKTKNEGTNIKDHGNLNNEIQQQQKENKLEIKKTLESK